MSYTKNIAVIKGLKDGFSADGGALSGLVKAERYSGRLKVEISLINFAPLSEGRYVAAVSDGSHTEIIENCYFEDNSRLDTGAGFAAVICYVNGGVQLIASATCGNFRTAIFGLKSEIERAEKIKGADVEPRNTEKQAEPLKIEKYEDEAIAEDNYYEFDAADKGGQPVCKSAQKEENGAEFNQNEKTACPEEIADDVRGIELSRGGFYEKMKGEIEGLLSTYPPCTELNAATDGSQWVKINYDDGKFYVFGVIRADGMPRYICYGVPSSDDKTPPDSMRGLSSFFPVKTEHGSGFWVMYQDADTGASIKIAID